MKIDRSSQHEGSANQKYGIWLTSSLLWVRSIRMQGLGLHTLVGVPKMPSRGVAGWVVVTREPLSFFGEVCGVPQTAIYRRSLCSKRVRGSTRVGK